MSPGENIIQVKGLTRRFKKTEALNGIDLEIGKGELFAIVGPDGSGKTTLLQCLCAILDPTEGKITVDRRDTVKEASKITSGIGYMSQSYSLYENLTVEENIEFFAKIRKIPHEVYVERRKRLLQFSGLSPFLERRTRHLSGGMQKKLALCCNLIHEPDILILDEPTLGVDPISRHQLWDIIGNYHNQGKTIIVATSYMDEASRCQRVAFLLDGKVLACDAPMAMGKRLEDVFFTHAKGGAGGQMVPFLIKRGEEVLVEVEGLVKKFGMFAAVGGISFIVKRGEIFGFLGPNGSGKTTTIKILCGILSPTEGRVMVAGTNVAMRPEAVKGRIGYMSQKFSLYLDLTVEENIDFFGGVYDIDGDTLTKRKAWVIEMAGLAGKEQVLTGELSGAIRQRLALGCALLHHPDIVFLDEPTSGVDPVSRQTFWEMIKTLALAGTTIFVTTHYLEEAEQCNRVAFLHRGHILAVEDPVTLKTSFHMDSMEEIFVRMVGQASENA